VVGDGLVGAIGEFVVADRTPFVNVEGIELTLGANDASHIGIIVGGAEGTFVGNDVEIVVGAVVGCSVGLSVGDVVGRVVGSLVGSFVGPFVRFNVGDCVGDTDGLRRLCFLIGASGVPMLAEFDGSSWLFIVPFSQSCGLRSSQTVSSIQASNEFTLA
jgi:hypothetical protein